MIDIHSHILPGVDDGAADLDASVELVRELASAGVTDIIATPHYVDETNYVSTVSANSKLLKKLSARLKKEKLDVRVFTAEQLTLEQMKEGMNSMRSRLYWANEYEITGAAAHYIQDRKIDGIITINAFGCGPDSMMLERIARYSRRRNKPILHLSIDEHTGEAGFVTRIEAFIDMLYRKKRTKILDKVRIDDSEKSIKIHYNDYIYENK